MRLQLDPEDVATLLEALQVAQSCGEHHEAVLALIALAYVNLQWVQPKRALLLAEEGRRYADDHEVDTMAGYLGAIVAQLHLRSGEWERAARLATAALRRYPHRQTTVTALQARTVLTELAVRRGDEEADEMLADLAADAERTGELKRIGQVLELQVERSLTRGDPLPVQRFDDVRDVVGSTPLREGVGAARVAAWAALCGLPTAFAGKAPPLTRR